MLSAPGRATGRFATFAIMEGTYHNDWHHLRANLLRISGWLRTRVNEVLEPFGITQPQFNILRILRGQQGRPISTQDIRERMLDRAGDASRLVDRLAAKKLISKSTSQADRRLIDVVISAEGLQLLAQIDAKMGEIDTILQVVSAEDAQALNRILDTISDRS